MQVPIINQTIMKILLKTLVIPLMLVCFFFIAETGIGQAPPPPPTSGTKGDDTNKAPGGGAPIDGGLVISLALIAAYGGFKTYKAFSKKKQAI